MPCTVCASRVASPRSLTIAQHCLTTPLCDHCADVVSGTLDQLRAWRASHATIGAQGPDPDATSPNHRPGGPPA